MYANLPLSPRKARHFPSQRQSVSLCFRVAMLLKTQFASLRIRGKLTLRKKVIKFYICTRIYVYLLPDSSLRVTWCFFSCHHSDSARRSRMTAEVLLVFLRYFNLCTQTCPYRLAKLGTSLRVRGEANAKEKRNYSFYYLNTLLTIIHAGFFAKSQIMFFLSSSFVFCPPLKNDGRGELRFREAVNDFCLKRKA